MVIEIEGFLPIEAISQPYQMCIFASAQTSLECHKSDITNLTTQHPPQSQYNDTGLNNMKCWTNRRKETKLHVYTTMAKFKKLVYFINAGFFPLNTR